MTIKLKEAMRAWLKEAIWKVDMPVALNDALIAAIDAEPTTEAQGEWTMKLKPGYYLFLGLSIGLIVWGFFLRGRPELQGWVLCGSIVSITAGFMWQICKR